MPLNMILNMPPWMLHPSGPMCRRAKNLNWSFLVVAQNSPLLAYPLHGDIYDIQKMYSTRWNGITGWKNLLLTFTVVLADQFTVYYLNIRLLLDILGDVLKMAFPSSCLIPETWKWIRNICRRSSLQIQTGVERYFLGYIQPAST